MTVSRTMKENGWVLGGFFLSPGVLHCIADTCSPSLLQNQTRLSHPANEHAFSFNHGRLPQLYSPAWTNSLISSSLSFSAQSIAAPSETSRFMSTSLRDGGGVAVSATGRASIDEGSGGGAAGGGGGAGYYSRGGMDSSGSAPAKELSVFERLQVR